MAAARSPLYPYLVAVSFPLGLALLNVEELPGVAATVTVFGFVLLLTAVLDGVGRQVVRDAARRALMISVVLAFSLGYSVVDVGLFRERIFSTVLIPALFFGGVLPLFWVALRVRNPERLAMFVRTAAVAFVCVQIVTAVPRVAALSGEAMEEEPEAVVPVGEARTEAAGVSRPDVYLIVLDGYARADMLERYNQLDNTEFLDALRSRGFFISDQARANYMYTRLSLSSSLNMRYLDEDIGPLGPNPPRGAIDPMLHQFEVAERMRQLGYTYRHVGGYWFVTRTSPIADENVAYLPGFIEQFTFVFLEQTIFHPFLKSIPAYGEWFQPAVVHLEQLKNIPKPEGRRGPVFTFAHVLCPHSPYVFDRNGIRSAETSLTEGWDRPLEYAEQVRYLNTQILKLIDEIDRVSGRDAIVLLHGDHGARSLGQLGGTPEQNLEQLATLAAYRVPPAAEVAIYPGMSLVNNWRVLFTTVFGATDLPLLEDRMFYSPLSRLYDVKEVDLAGHFIEGDAPTAAADRRPASGLPQ